MLRSAGDKGTIIILDRRIKTAGYGRLFLDALPTTSVSEMTDSELEAYVAGEKNKSRIKRLLRCGSRMVFYLKADFPLCDTSMACPEMEYD